MFICSDVMTVCILNSGTSILAGFTVFAILGHVALNQGQDVADVVTEGKIELIILVSFPINIFLWLISNILIEIKFKFFY